MKTIILRLLIIVMLSGCGISDVIKRNDDRYLQPGALEVPVGTVFDTYQYKFLDKFYITHSWPQNAGTCDYRTIDKGRDRFGGRIFEGRDFFEADGHIWLRFGKLKPFIFDSYVRSIKVMDPIYGDVNGVHQKIGERELENGLRSLCFYSWYLTSHSLGLRLHKRDLKTWKALYTEYNPKGKWSEQTVGNNVWTVQEIPEQELAPRRLNASGGWFQNWLLPIGDTGYTFYMQLGASKESLQTPQGHAAMKKMFRQMIESVRIESLQP